MDNEVKGSDEVGKDPIELLQEKEAVIVRISADRDTAIKLNGQLKEVVNGLEQEIAGERNLATLARDSEAQLRKERNHAVDLTNPLKAEVRELTRRLDVVRADLHNANVLNEQQRRELQASKQKVSAMEATAEAMQRARDQAQAAATKAEDDRRAADNRRIKLQERLDPMPAHIAKLEKEIEQLNVALAKFQGKTKAAVKA